MHVGDSFFKRSYHEVIGSGKKDKTFPKERQEVLGCSFTKLDGVHLEGNPPSNLTSLQVSMSAGIVFTDCKGSDQVVRKRIQKNNGHLLRRFTRYKTCFFEGDPFDPYQPFWCLCGFSANAVQVPVRYTCTTS